MMGDNRTASPSLTAVYNSASSATAGTAGEKWKKRSPASGFTDCAVEVDR